MCDDYIKCDFCREFPVKDDCDAITISFNEPKTEEDLGVDLTFSLRLTGRRTRLAFLCPGCKKELTADIKRQVKHFLLYSHFPK